MTVSRRERPRWTKRRLRTALALAYGTASNGGLHTAAAAADLGISQRQLQRWIEGDGRETLPEDRQDKLMLLISPPERTLRQESIDAKYAVMAIALITSEHQTNSRREAKGQKPAAGDESVAMWNQRQWLTPHEVLVLDVADGELKQITFTRATGTSTAVRRRGAVIDTVVVPTRFHATLVANTLLAHAGSWRVDPRAVGLPASSRVVFADTPLADLSDVAAAVPA